MDADLLYLDIHNPLLTGEVWREHPRFPGYFVSNLGRVRGRTGRLLRQSDRGGYLRVRAPDHTGKDKDMMVHQAVLEAFVGPRPQPDWESSHMNGNSKDNRATNLKWCTKSENAIQRVAHGRGPDMNGERNPYAKVCDYMVNTTRALCLDRRMSIGELHRISGMPESTIAHILHGRRRLKKTAC